ncbi:hypothetical protein V7167_19480, partial [Bacillus toyonensis]
PGDEDDPVTMNGYTYADNNPVMMVDPDGHVAWWVGSAAIGAGWEVKIEIRDTHGKEDLKQRDMEWLKG